VASAFSRKSTLITDTAKLEIAKQKLVSGTGDMSVSISCPQLGDAGLRSQLTAAVKTVVKRWRPAFERWRLSLFKSQSGSGWDLAISGPRFRKVFTLNGPVEDLPGLVSAYIDAILAQISEPRTIPNH